MHIDNLLLIAAMEVEEKAVLAELKWEEVTVSAQFGLKAKLARVGDKKIWILMSGIGAVNAAMGAALLLEKNPIDAIILLGVGGALSEKLKMGDIVIARHVLQHDSVISGDKGTHLMFPGDLFLANPVAEPMKPHIPTHPELRAWVKSLVPTDRHEALYEGTILSGAEFVGTTARKRAIAGHDADALLVEMEATGVAQVALKSKTPFVVVKTVADTLSPQSSVLGEFYDFVEAASEHAGQIARNLVKSFQN